MGGGGLHDRAAVGVAVGRRLVTVRPINMKVGVDGPSRGRTIGGEGRLNDPHRTMGAALDVGVPRFLDEFMTRITNVAKNA